jgi:hypothetical protein
LTPYTHLWCITPFLVRIRQQDETAGSQWRGSVQEVSSGKRRFISGTRDDIEFIASYLREHNTES